MFFPGIHTAPMLFSADAEGSGGDASAKEPETFSAMFVRELRGEAKSWRLRFQESEVKLQSATTKLQEAEASREQATKGLETSVSKAVKETEDRLSKATSARLISAELKAGAATAGLAHADFLKLIDASAVTVGDDGEVKVPEGFWAKAKESLPHLFHATGAERGTTSNTSQAPKPAPTTGKHVSQMTDDEAAAAEAALLNIRR